MPKSKKPLQNPGPFAPAKRKPEDVPHEVAAIRDEIRKFLNLSDANGKRIGASTCGVYAFYDYDGEPIYIGQTYEGLGARIGRHLTNQRTDAVAMKVLDPFEVAEICVWPLNIGHLPPPERNAVLNRAEYTLYRKVIEESSFKAVLNEMAPGTTDVIELPPCFRGRIIPEAIYPHRKHPDIRIARRASTIAALARVISERKVTKYLRATLLTQARRLEKLAAERYAEVSGEPNEVELESSD